MPKNIILFIIFALTLNVSAMPSADVEATAKEFQIKAAFLFSLANFVQWPPQALHGDNAMYICTLGDDSFHDILKLTLENVRIKGRPLVARFLRTNIAQVRSCHVIYVAPSIEWRISEILAALGTRSKVVVGEGKDFSTRYGAVGFFLKNNKIRLSICKQQLTKAGFRIDPNLLMLSHIPNECK